MANASHNAHSSSFIRLLRVETCNPYHLYSKYLLTLLNDEGIAPAVKLHGNLDF